MATLADALIEAHRLHEAGRNGEARALLLAVIEQAPAPLPGAYALLGHVAKAEGKLDEAIDWLAQAIDAAPDEPGHRLVLASLALERGAFEEAEELCREALALSPGSAPALTGIGIALERRGRRTEALAQFRAALAAESAYAPAAFHLGTALLAAGTFVEAEAALRRALRHMPDDLDVLNNLALALRAQGMDEDALPLLLRAGADPACPPLILVTLAETLRALGRLEEAAQRARAALETHPDEPALHDALGRACLDLDDLANAQASFRRAAALDPQAWPCFEGLGHALKRANRRTEARAAYAQAAALTGQKGPRVNLALLELLEGNNASGFPALADLWREGVRFSALDIPGPLWDGTPMESEPLLVDAGADLGQAILLGRFLPEARRRVGRLVLACRPEILPLFKGHPGVDLALSEGDVPGGYSAWAALDCLPGLLGAGDIPAPAPLPVRRSAWENWGRRLQARPDGAIRIGLAWMDADTGVGMPFAALQPLVDSPGLVFHGLSPSPDAVPDAGWITLLGEEIEDLGEAAACLSHLDAIITIDGMLAHLAGALGVPGIVLLPPVAAWPWGVAERSPWHGSLRPLRAPGPLKTDADWTRLVRRSMAELRTMLAGG
jgi:Flp pilus assembly protein TadD